MHAPQIRMNFLRALCVSLAALLCMPSATAVEPSVEEMVDSLARKQTPEPAAGGARMRSLASSAAAPTTGRLQLSVQFEFVSARISAESHALLAKLGSVMNSPVLAGPSFRIEGHTDGVGARSLVPLG
jgi:outer membrane protein OmpA-like peptidoglycan-associated protein